MKSVNQELAMKLVLQSLFLTLVFLSGLAGCNTIEGMGEDIEAAGETIDETAEEQ
jgi:predicted small secreted protein